MSGDGMSTFISGLMDTDGLTSANLWAEATNAVPLIVGVAVFAFGFYIVRRVTKRSCKRKSKILEFNIFENAMNLGGFLASLFL